VKKAVKPLYKIRKARPTTSTADRNAILTLQLETLPYDHVVVPDKHHWWLAFDTQGKAVGYCGVMLSGKRAYMCRAGVTAAHQGHGLQRQFIRLREAFAKKLGATRITSDTVASNIPSSNNLMRCGFTLYLPSHPYGYKETLYWHKRLDAKAASMGHL
jgi:GNAT superfamily N-acetyltransferase